MGHSALRHIKDIFVKKNPIQFTFFVTKRCNARCPFCFYISEGDREVNKRARDQELTLDEIRAISASLPNLLWLAFSGGEIFLRDDLAEITKVFYKQNKPVIILFPTNGLLTKRIKDVVTEVLEACPKSSIVVKLSLDGDQETHDSIRGVAGSYQKTLETCAELSELLEKYPNFDLGINTVFCAKNEDLVKGLIDQVAGMKGVRTHTVSLVRGDMADSTLKQVNMDKYKAAIAQLESNLKEKTGSIYRFPGARLKASQDIVQRRLIDRTAREHRRLIPCYAGRLNLVLTENGNVFPCESFDMGLGNIRDHGLDFRRILATEQAEKMKDWIENDGCHCTHECYFMTNILFNPRLYPALIKEYFQLQPRG